MHWMPVIIVHRTGGGPRSHHDYGRTIHKGHGYRTGWARDHRISLLPAVHWMAVIMRNWRAGVHWILVITVERRGAALSRDHRSSRLSAVRWIQVITADRRHAPDTGRAVVCDHTGRRPYCPPRT